MNGPNGRFNQDGDLRPITSAYGRGLHAMVRGRSFRDFPQGEAARDVGGRHAVVWSFAPLLVPEPVTNLVGGLATRAAQVRPVLGGFGYYDGILPLEQQPNLDKPWPWNDPTRGAP